jgi:CarboxypepD_reg-like domain
VDDGFCYGFNAFANEPTRSSSNKRKSGASRTSGEKTAMPIKRDLVIHQVTIRGVVRAKDDNLGMPGVNVLQKGSTNGTVTNGDGKFELIIKKPAPSATLQFSFIGFETTEKTIAINSTFKETNLTLPYDLQAMNEVVVTGGVCITPHYSPRRLWWKIKGIFRK